MSVVTGNTKGLKHSHKLRLEKLASKRIPARSVITQEAARQLTQISFEIGRQIGLLLDRRGDVYKLIVGDAKSILIPKLHGWRIGLGRLRGLRLVHTHLKDEALSREDFADLALLRLDLIAAVGVDQEGFPTVAYIAHLMPENPHGEIWQTLDPAPPSLLNLDFLDFVKALEDEISRSASVHAVKDMERAYLVGKTLGSEWEVEESLEELAELARSCGVQVVGSTVQRRNSVEPHFVVGKGKLKEIVIDALQKSADLLIFDTELSPAQVKSIADFTELKVIDRSQLILDIFAQRAKSREGKIQVELAQLKYALPRLSEKDNALSRLTGGIGGRGPGETKLEIDRRRIDSRITFLEGQIRGLSRNRLLRRNLRARRGIPVISIVGYTNAGKSTLLNHLTKSSILAENKLFATLDPTSRRLRFPRETEAIVTDTVGFLQDLPETLVAAFSATLDELASADLLLHVIDASNAAYEKQMNAVERLLDKLGFSHIPRVRVFNKEDLVIPEIILNMCNTYDGIAVSALNPKSFPPLISLIEGELLQSLERRERALPEHDEAPSHSGAAI